MNAVSLLTATLILSTFLASNPPASAPLEELPTGNYYYEELASSQRGRRQYVLLRKAGRVVVGIEVGPKSGNACFKGFVEQNSVVTATRIFPPYAPDSRWEHQRGEAINLNRYRRTDWTGTDSDKAALLKCLQLFSR